MANAFDVVNRIADDVYDLLGPMEGQKFEIPGWADIERYGPFFIFPPTLSAVSRPLQQELEDRLSSGKLTVSVESDIHDGPVVQYVNDGQQQDLLYRTPLTVTVDNVAPCVWIFDGTPTLGNMVGVQSGPSGATYAVQPTDSPATIANGIAAACVAEGISCVALGPSITIGYDDVVNLGSTATYVKAIARRTRNFDVWVWAADPFVRAAAVDALESLYPPGTKVPLPDGSEFVAVELIGSLQQDPTSDGEIRDGLFIGRTRWSIRFTVTQTVEKTPVLAVSYSLAVSDSPLDPLAPLDASLL